MPLPSESTAAAVSLDPELKAHQMCACFNLRKTSRAVTQYYDLKLAPAGIRATQLGILAVLTHRGSSKLSDLADALVMDRTTLTRNLRPLERRGFIQLDAGDDRRTRRVSITPAGTRAKLAAYPLWKEAQRDIAGRFGVERWKDIVAMLDEIVSLTQVDGDNVAER